MAIKDKVTPLRDDILVTDLEFGEERTTSGLYIPSQNGKVEGIKSRWGRVYAIGSEQTDVKVNDWIYVKHGRWTRGIEMEDENGKKFVIHKVDNNDVLLQSDEKPTDINF